MPAGVSPYLTTQEAAQALGVSVWTVHRMVRDERLPALRVGPYSVRVEAQAVQPFAPEPDPAEMNATELATWLRVSQNTLTQLLRAGRLRGVKRGRTVVFPRATLLRFLSDSTTGDS